MGNIGSHTGQITQRPLPEEQQWAHSFPRSQQRLYRHKVLPERDVRLKLRSTNNGEILQSGGTLSGRQQNRLSLEKDDESSPSESSSPSVELNEVQKPQGRTSRTYLSNQRDPLHKSKSPYRYGPRPDNRQSQGQPNGMVMQNVGPNYKDQLKKFGSEPDLRYSGHEEENSATKEKMKGRKKYKAPPPPPNLQMVSSSDKRDLNAVSEWNENFNREGEISSPMRRARLFKTRAEVKRNYSSPVHSFNHDCDHNNQHKHDLSAVGVDFNANIELLPSKPNIVQALGATDPKLDQVQLRKRDLGGIKANRLSLPEISMSKTTDFQEELKEATKRLRHTKLEATDQESINNERNIRGSREKLKTLDHNINRKDNLRRKLKELNMEHKQRYQHPQNCVPLDCLRGEGSGKESTTPDRSPPALSRNINDDKERNRNRNLNKKDNQQSNVKTFYFGMDNREEPLPQVDDFRNDFDIMNNFHSSLHITHTNELQRRRHSSESDLSSELEMDETESSKNGIDLQLRPILPKKQLEIPRFSPAAAWKLLSALEANPEASTIASDDVPVFVEERIEKFSRPPPPLAAIQVGPRSTNDKSGDSGISGDAGDAGPSGFDDPDLNHCRNPMQLSSPSGRSQGLSWTPQQDLGDDTSLEEGTHHRDDGDGDQVELEGDEDESGYKARLVNKPHVFSLSLPRDNHLAAYMVERHVDSFTYTGLQRLKRSVSGVLSNLSNHNSNGNSKGKLIQPNSQDQSDNWFLSKSAPNSLNNGFNSLDVKHSTKSEENDKLLVPSAKQNSGRLMYLPEFDSFDSSYRLGRKRTRPDRSRSAERSNHEHKLSVFSKSCENIPVETKSSSEPEPEDLQDPPPPPAMSRAEERWRTNRKPKRFTFQSTVRQIERKRLAEKLSREAERKEMQRLRELEAMQKVEEEFQRKRAREKANIRQQLRIFSMEDTTWPGMPPDVDKSDVPMRSEPDGAVSSSATSSPSLPLQKSTETTKKYHKNKKNNTKYKQQIRQQLTNSESSEETRMKAPATQVLSEYRQPRREYKEYRLSNRYLNDVSENYPKQTTVHPQVMCNMPKAKGQDSAKNTTNYRKDFAHGVKSTRSIDSTYSEDSQQQCRKMSPRMYHSKHAPITRF